ncbi:MAG TPA: DsrE/DsrF/DrsH-like family protein [Candidatus Limnocylindria bacterium]
MLKEQEAKKETTPKKMAVIATKGTLDWAYPPLVLASTAASLGWDVGVFFTFYGLNIVHKTKSKSIGIVPVGNPAMPMPVPVPNLLGALPGMTPFATFMMKKKFKDHGVASIPELTELCFEAGVKMMPCAMTMDVFGYKKTDFMEGCQDICGAAHFLSWASDADITLAF